MNISIIGSGSWGTALSVTLAKTEHQVKLWSFFQKESEDIAKNRENREFLPGVKIPKNVQAVYNKEQAAKDAEMIVLAVPSKFVRDTVRAFLPYLKEGQIVVNVAKGLEEETLMRLSEVILSVAPFVKVCALSGPSHAEEVGFGLPTTCVAASTDTAVSETVQAAFMNAHFRIYTNADIIGVELGGALKNVIALSAGMSDGLGFGDNAKAALTTRGIVEISRLGVAMGARANTFAGLSGIGDLIVTCTSMHSRNRRAGILLGQGKSLAETLEEVHMVVEGVNTAKAAFLLSEKYGVNMPITKEINEVLFNGKSAKQAVIDLMMRDKRTEHEKEDL